MFRFIYVFLKLGFIIFFTVSSINFTLAIVNEIIKCGLDAFSQPLPNNAKFIDIAPILLGIIILLVAMVVKKKEYKARVKKAVLIEQRHLMTIIEQYKQEKLDREERNKKFQKEREENDLSNHDNQLRFISNPYLRFELSNVINREAYLNAFRYIETAINNVTSTYNIPHKYRVLAEVPLIACIKLNKDYGTKDARTKATHSYSAKRIDFLIIDPYGSPILAVEYNGSGHSLGSSSQIRDLIKEKVLKAVNLKLYVIDFHATPSIFTGRVKDLMAYVHNEIIRHNSIIVLNKRPINAYTPLY
ncbi:MAG: DUF2726 domain-containing protein [Solitalea-like symbiont of Tyrophagus putrescentiae]